MSAIDYKLINYGNLSAFHTMLLNDSSVSDKATWSSSKISSMIADAGFNVEFVNELPASGDVHTIYFVPSSNPETQNVKDEFMWTGSAWEQVGSTAIDMTPYATIANVDASLALKQNALTAGQNIAIDASNNISAEGYVFDSSNGNFIEKYRQDSDDGGQLLANVIAAGTIASHAEGYNCSISGLGYGAHAEGQQTYVSGYSAHAEGSRTIASGNMSHAEGDRSLASGNRSHAEGYMSAASGIYAHAEGGNSSAGAPSSHAEGYSTITRGKGSGQGNEGWGAHAEGWSTIAEGDAAHAEGAYTLASGAYSHAEGLGSTATGLNTANGYGSHVEGSMTIANNVGEHAEGILNVSHTQGDHTSAHWDSSIDTISAIGAGTYTNGRRNAREIMMNGDYYLLGVGNYDGIHIKGETGAPANLQTLQEVVNGKADSYEVATNAEIEALFTPPAPPTQPNDEIWYTTTNGQIAESQDYDPMPSNVNIVSNTYENGKGIVKFDGDLTDLGTDVFNSASNLQTVSFPNSLTTIESASLQGCSNLTTIENWGDSLEAIYDSAMGDSCYKLSNVDALPVSLNSIGSGVFGSPRLTEIDYDGTMSQWNLINISEYEFWGGDIRVVHCSDGDIEVGPTS